MPHSQPREQQPRDFYQQMNLYTLPPPAYGTRSGLLQTTMASSHPQPIASAPASRRILSVLCPMPAGGIMPQLGMTSPSGHGSVMPSGVNEADQPRCDVGPQARRGILPSTPSRPAAIPTGTGNAESKVMPVQDADGKFPCPHCTKTFSQDKGRKRHLLRHTGTRPYRCSLCDKAFARSDIRNVHSQKCFLPLGNSTGASHLSYRKANHVKNPFENQAVAQEAATAWSGGLDHLNGLNNVPADTRAQPLDMMLVPHEMSSLASDQSQLSRACSLVKLDNDNPQYEWDMMGPVMNATDRGNNFEHARPDTISQPMSERTVLEWNVIFESPIES
ncbi:C2H2 transcription factor [Colletotrichum abscissum]|uniref:C2H2 transcription factor n=1 Tax=Colletotrichum abscissum TaxID=1671311 RepID=A0A9P9X1Y4_9PEZI|nr:C2H2 transcription factor [Colletotrichum abscissum]